MVFASTVQKSIIFLVGASSVEKVAADGFLRKVNIREMEVDLQATLSSLLTRSGSQKVELMERRLWPTFQALPRNEAGRLAPASVRYIVHDYFAREHGWLIKGLEPHGMQFNVSEVHDVNILMDKAPAVVESLLEARQADRGLSFNDVVTMAAVLEQMMFDESVTLLQAAYKLNRLSVSEAINKATLHTVLKSYLLLFGQGSKANLEDVERFQAYLAMDKPDLEEFEHDTVLNYEFKHRHTINHFKPRLYSFQDAVDIMENLAQQYGKWQNAECRDMKAHLKELDPEGLGRVPLGLFYGQPASASYHFSESADYLRQIGALDETTPGNPKVIITNYVTGPSNCIASSSYYSVCCLSECADILAELESKVGASSASPEKLLNLMGHISDKALPKELPDKLRKIAANTGGEVFLHGRLFAQWMHFAMPHECPFPSVVENSALLTPSLWLDGKSIVTAEEKLHHVTSAASGEAPSAKDFDIDARWSDDEVLPLHGRPTESWVGAASLRTVVQITAVVVALRAALTAFKGATSINKGDKKQDDDYCPQYDMGFRV